jgi:hypothetical protein
MPSVLNSKWRPNALLSNCAHIQRFAFCSQLHAPYEEQCAKENSFLESAVLRCALTLGNLRTTYVEREDRYE